MIFSNLDIKKKRIAIKKLKSIITIYQDNEEIWRGRVLNDKLDFYNRKQVECER